jgi:hypothetical protein
LTHPIFSSIFSLVFESKIPPILFALIFAFTGSIAIKKFLNKENRIQQTEHLLQALVNDEKANPKILNDLIWDFVKHGKNTPTQLELVYTAAKKMVGLDPHFAPLDTLATVCFQMGKYDEAIENEMKALDFIDSGLTDKDFHFFQLARFLSERKRHRGIFIKGDIRSEDIEMRFTETIEWKLKKQWSQGASLIAVIKKDKINVGLLRVDWNPTTPLHVPFSIKKQDIPIPWSETHELDIVYLEANHRRNFDGSWIWNFYPINPNLKIEDF